MKFVYKHTYPWAERWGRPRSNWKFQHYFTLPFFLKPLAPLFWAKNLSRLCKSASQWRTTQWIWILFSLKCNFPWFHIYSCVSYIVWRYTRFPRTFTQCLTLQEGSLPWGSILNRGRLQALKDNCPPFRTATPPRFYFVKNNTQPEDKDTTRSLPENEKRHRLKHSSYVHQHHLVIATGKRWVRLLVNIHAVLVVSFSTDALCCILYQSPGVSTRMLLSQAWPSHLPLKKVEI